MDPMKKVVITVVTISGWVTAGLIAHGYQKQLAEAREILQEQGEVIEKATTIVDNETFQEIIDNNDM